MSKKATSDLRASTAGKRLRGRAAQIEAAVGGAQKKRPPAKRPKARPMGRKR